MTEREPGAGRGYLMNDDHWRIAHVGEFAAFFRAVHLLDPPPVFVALAAGAWPREVQESLSHPAPAMVLDPELAFVHCSGQDGVRSKVPEPLGDPLAHSAP